MALESLFQKYDRLVIFDTETTGLSFQRDEIIEFAAVVVEQKDGQPVVDFFQVTERFIHFTLGGIVQCRCSFIQQQDIDVFI